LIYISYQYKQQGKIVELLVGPKILEDGPQESNAEKNDFSSKHSWKSIRKFNWEEDLQNSEYPLFFGFLCFGGGGV